MGVLDHLACLLRNLYVGQEGTGRTKHETIEWLKIGKGVQQGCIFSVCLFNSLDLGCGVAPLGHSCAITALRSWSPPLTLARGSSSWPRFCVVHRTTCREHHVKYQTGWITSWNQDCQEKYQQPQIYTCSHSNGRKWRRTEEPLDEAERREWKSWLKSQSSKY